MDRTVLVITLASFAVVAVTAVAADSPDPRARCYDTVLAALKDPSPWVRAHAAEALAQSHRPDPALHAFRPLADTAEQKYRIVVWRILAQAEPDAEVRRRYVERIRAALLDRDGVEQAHAMEALAKLQEPPSDDRERAAVRETADSGGPIAPFAVWRLAQANDPTAVDRLVALLGSPDAVTRARAAYAISRIGPPSDSALAAIVATLKSEPADSPARVMLGVARGAEAAREMLSDANGPAQGRYFAAMYLAENGTSDDLKAITGLLDDRDADVRVAAAYAVLRIQDRARRPATQG